LREAGVPYRRKPIAERFWKRVEKTAGCWCWTGGRLPKGYGTFSVPRDDDSSRNRGVYAHRISWELHNGPIPDGMVVMHTCDNPPCVRPDHLTLGTAADNLRDMRQKGRGPRGDTHGWRVHPESVPRGERHWNAKLTAEQVTAIRERKGEPVAALAVEYGVSAALIRYTQAGKGWQRID
jgi:hypothetical protein